MTARRKPADKPAGDEQKQDEGAVSSAEAAPPAKAKSTAKVIAHAGGWTLRDDGQGWQVDGDA